VKESAPPERPHVAIADSAATTTTAGSATATATATPTRSATAPPRRSATPSKRVSQANSTPKPLSPKPLSPPKSNNSKEKPPTVVLVNNTPTSPTSTAISHPTTPPPSQPPPPPPATKNAKANTGASSEDIMFQMLLGQAQVGDAASQFWLAQMYQYGAVDNASDDIVKAPDLDLAMAWIQKKTKTAMVPHPAHDNMTIMKNYQLGLCWEYGTNHDNTSNKGGKATNLENAVLSYQRALAAAAHQQHYSNNSNNLNNQMDVAILVQDALERAESKLQQFQLEHLKDLADKEGDANAQYQLGLYYWNNTNEKKNAVEYWELAANQDHGLAQCRLGECYEEGVFADEEGNNDKRDDNVIVPKSLQEAFIMYEWSVEDKCIEAHFKLGWFYEDGRGGAGVGPGDYDQALELYDQALVLAKKQEASPSSSSSQQEDHKETVSKYVKALLRIGAIYEHGTTFEPSGDESDEDSTSIEPDLAKAILLYEKAAANAPPKQDLDKEQEEEDKNADDDDDDDSNVNGARDFYIQALVRIGSFYENGTGKGGVQEPNFEKALEFYHKAAATTMTETMVTTTTHEYQDESKKIVTTEDTMDQYMLAIVRIGTSFYEANANLIDHHFVMVLGLFEQAEAAAASAETSDYEENKSRHVHVIYEIGCFYEEQGQPDPTKDADKDIDNTIRNAKMEKALELYEQAGKLGSNEARSAMKRIKMQRRKQELLLKRRNKGKLESAAVEAREVPSQQETTKDGDDHSASRPNEDDKDTAPTEGDDIDENPIYADPTENNDAVQDAGGDIDVEQQ